MRTVLGIDLGTTNSLAASLKKGGATMIKKGDERAHVPSVVAWSEGEILVGEDALLPGVEGPIVRRIKRKMGSDYKVRLGEREYSPEEISAIILKKLYAKAEQLSGQKIQDAVITVPAYFNDNQRQATKNAGELAGLNVLRIINEPTAAALAYGIRPEDDCNVVVYDLGGGTFDISVLNVADGIFEVLSTAGDNNLGGEDFTGRLQELVIERFKDETGVDLAKDPLAMAELYKAVEKAKRELSEKEQTELFIPFISADEEGPIDLKTSFTREEFNRLISDYIRRTVELTRQAIKDAELELSDIDRVILVGGSSRIPLVHKSVGTLFGFTPDFSIDPEEVVAMGAAIQGGILGGEVNDVVLVDVIPLSLGIEVEKGYFVPLIERNSPIPTMAKRVFTTVSDRQKSVDIRVFQGESLYCKNNISLGQFRFEGFPEASAGVPRIEVSFEVDVNGILNVTAKDVETGKAQSVKIVNESRLSSEEIHALKKQYENGFRKEISERKTLEKVLVLKTRAEMLASRVEQRLPDQDSLIRSEIAEVMKLMDDGVEKLEIAKVKQALSTLEKMLSEVKAGHVSVKREA